MNIKTSSLEKKIGINFKDKKILIRSLIHKSFDANINNEKLEFLGDRVLGLVISKKLFDIYPNDKEGSLDKKFASLVNKKKCLEIAKNLNLEKHIIINSNKKKTKIEDKIISDTCEALIGAIYLDQNLNIAENFILKFWNNHFKDTINTVLDSKTKLQEYSLKKFKTLPVYKFISNTGPRHKPLFNISVKLKDTKFYSAEGSSKKDAEQNAASKLLKKLAL